MTEIPNIRIGNGFNEIPKDVWEDALKHAEEYLLDDEPQALEFALAMAIIGERVRCAAIANKISADVRNNSEQRIAACKIVGLIRGEP
jgi:hypothetical protein